MIWSSLAPKWPILVPFSAMDHQKSKFLLVYEPFLWEVVEESQCYFFENRLMKLKYLNLLKPLGTIIHYNYQFFYPSGPIYFALFNVRHPVVQCRTSNMYYFWAVSNLSQNTVFFYNSFENSFFKLTLNHVLITLTTI